MIRWILASLHLLALGIGLGAVWVRARALRSPLDDSGVRRVLAADTLWGIAAFLWIATGLLRAFGGFEKGTASYLQSPLFWTKMALLALILLLEIRPMIALIQWRIAAAQGKAIDTRLTHAFARISEIQSLLLVVMVFVATAMARGLRF